MSTDKDLSYLVKLQGRKVRTFKGGPESKEGLLLQVKQDYIALLTDDNNVVYYQTSHLKSVVENSKTSIEPTTNSEEYEVLESDSFKEILKLMEFKNVQIDRGGPESLTGTLLGISDNFLTLRSENNVDVHYQIHHIKSVSVEKGEAAENPTTYVAPAESFSSLLKSFQHSWVTINRGGPESVEGVLAEMTKDYVTVIHHEKVFRLTEYHIRNISQGSKHDQKKQQENSENQQEEQNQTDNQTENNSNKQENQKNEENKSTNEKNKKQKEETTTSQQEVTKNNSSDKNNKQKQEETSKQQEDAKNNSSDKNKEQKQETTSKQQADTSNASATDKNNRKREAYNMLIKQVSSNLEAALKQAQNRINN
ncbi:hypothetical protein [Metabacillus rhizolycopersici]|uniref:Spore coat protein n=1 Tax=Metabacillus rhizolycopersici TaxID=2875709 RepID=A0ABS7UXF9_9BACI|nr:hypothetical protein [Metabacillus rhizolycopersici]MBZ5752729.1 hypothetical protein [Metabacillus rhizolycopersici]